LMFQRVTDDLDLRGAHAVIWKQLLEPLKTTTEQPAPAAKKKLTKKQLTKRKR
jgi:hypothetical protein